jgi:glycosyltransferase involved in cell wall biosynthesis
LIHVWEPLALRVVRLVTGRKTPLVVSVPFLPRKRGRNSALNRWLLRRARRVAASGPAEAEGCRRLGLLPEQVVEVPPGVDAAESHGELGELPLPPAARAIVCVGPLEAHKGFRDAVWSMDILKYLYDDLHLLIVGIGPERRRLEEFARDIRAIDRVHFLGPRADLAAVVARADLVWVPSRADAGVNVALEAMAQARPVIASRLPSLAEVISDGQTGILVPVGDKPALARQTRLLLDDAERRRHLGEAAARHVKRNFSVATMVRRFAQLYVENAR